MKRYLMFIVVLFLGVGALLALDNIAAFSPEGYFEGFAFLIFFGFVFTFYTLKKRKSIWYLLPITFFLGVIFYIYLTKEEYLDKEMVVVARVVDGDTLEVWRDGQKKVVRLIGVDAPEIQKGECFGEESKRYMEELIADKSTWIIGDRKSQNKDRYGRLLRYVYLADGEMANVIIVREGYAKEYFFGGVWYEYRNKFVEAEKEASLQNKGLWGKCVN